MSAAGPSPGRGARFAFASAAIVLGTSIATAGSAGPAKPGFAFVPGNTVSIDGNSMGYGHAADLDGNGTDEVVLAPGSFPERRSTKLPILRWTGSAFKDKRKAYLPGTLKSDAFTDILTGDFNRDGRVDLYVGAFGYDDDPFPGSKDYLLIQKSGGGLKDMSGQISGKASTTAAVAAGDINKDRYPDLFVVTLNTEPDKATHFLLNKGKGKFALKRKLINPAYAEPDGAAALGSAAIADIDNDGWNDLVVGREDGIYVGVYLNDKGSFRKPAPDITLPDLAHGPGSSNPLDIQPVDFNHDGYVDLIIFSAQWPDYAGFSLQAFQNKKGKAFKDVTASVFKGSPLVRPDLAGLDRLRPVDFYGDGLTDFISIQEHGPHSTSTIFINTGNGRFVEHDWSFFRAVQGHSYRAVVPADIDGDGRVDIVTPYLIAEGDPSTYQVEAFLNQGVAPADIKTKPKISTGPARQTVRKGGRLHLSVLVSGDRPFAYRWYKDGKKLKGETGPMLSIGKAKASDAGKYQVRISNAAGSAKSGKAKVTVR